MLAHAAETTLPRQATLVYDARLGGLPVGEVSQRWSLQGNRYTLKTEIKPIFGPRIRYESLGEQTSSGLKPEHYQEIRDEQVRVSASFDWRVSQLRLADGETASLPGGAQDLNALPYHLGLQTERALSLSVLSGKHLRPASFQSETGTRFTLQGRTLDVRVWRAVDGRDRTEFWLAPALGNLPVRIVRQEDRGEVSFVAKQIEFTP
jgi:hypothetical protein